MSSSRPGPPRRNQPQPGSAGPRRFEYVAQAPNFTRHALTTVGVNTGSLYTLTTGANQRRWKKMEDRLNKIVDSFQFLF